jgi:hypothetical protein
MVLKASLRTRTRTRTRINITARNKTNKLRIVAREKESHKQGRFYVGAGGAVAPPNVGVARPNFETCFF